MKKLLVLALTVIFVLSMAAVSMAAVTVGGELNFKYDFSKDDDKSVNTGNENTGYGMDIIDGKVTVTADLNDSVKGFIALKEDAGNNVKGKSLAIDEEWAQLTTDFATFKFGYFGWGFGGKKDILDIGMKDLKSEVGTLATIAAGEGIAVNVYYGLDGSVAGDLAQGDGAYGLGVTYANDTFGGGLQIANYGVKDKMDGAMALNFFYNLAPVQFYIVYDTFKANKSDSKAWVDELIGVSFAPSDSPVYARFEYNLDDHKDSNGDALKFNMWGAYVGYKFENGLKLQYCRKQNGTKAFNNGDASEIKLTLAF